MEPTSAADAGADAADARARYLLGQQRLLAGDPRHAIPELREATRLSPSNAEYHAELANAYYAVGAEHAAAAAYRTALHLFPNHATQAARLWASRARLTEYQASSLGHRPKGQSDGGRVPATTAALVVVVAALTVTVLLVGSIALGPDDDEGPGIELSF